MDLSRRTFLKTTGLGNLGTALSSLGLDVPKVKAAAKTFKSPTCSRKSLKLA